MKEKSKSKMDEEIPIIYDSDDFEIQINTDNTSPGSDGVLDLVTPTPVVVENPILPSTITFAHNATTASAVAGSAIPAIDTAGIGQTGGRYKDK